MTPHFTRPRQFIFNSKRSWRSYCVAALCASVQYASAGVDIAGQVRGVQIAADGKLWFALQPDTGSTYCQPGWAGLNMFVPRDHPEYPFYYGMLMMALSKGKNIYIPNISVFNGTTSCDITRTGYGMYTY